MEGNLCVEGRTLQDNFLHKFNFFFFDKSGDLQNFQIH